jgi:Ca2+-binding RTX toxin-like protein
MAETLTDGDDVWRARFFDFDYTVFAGDGDDVLAARDGDDTLFGEEGDDIIHGFGGDDRVWGGSENDLIFGYDGDDYLSGDDDNDTLIGDQGRDDLFGGDGDDELVSNSRFLTVTTVNTRAAAGHDGTATPENSPDLDFGGIMSGGAGDDIIFTSHDFIGVMEIHGGDDFDTLRFEADQFRLDMGAATPVNRVDLEAGIGVTPFGSTLEVTGIEAVLGSTFYRDEFHGDNNVNHLTGFGGDDRLEGRGGADILDGGDGVHDVADYSSSPMVGFRLGVDVDLTRFSQLRGDAEGDRLFGIEDVDGSFFHDTLRGNGHANYLYGNRADDTLEGRGGADTLEGGAGIDTASYESSALGVQVMLDDLALGEESITAGGDAVGDVLISIENLIGSGQGDALIGNSMNNEIQGRNGADEIYGLGGLDTLLGGDGNDQISGHEGNDTIDGGFGDDTLGGDEDTDTVSFESWDPAPFTVPPLESIRIALGEGTVLGSAVRSAVISFPGPFEVVETDTLSGFENVRGSNRPETIVGNSGGNTLGGRGGTDVLEGRGGSDTLDGGAGSDTASYENHADIVTVILGDGAAAGSATEFGVRAGDRIVLSTDTLRNIENVRGSAFNDTITGNGEANRLEGRGGGDTLRGNGGLDTLVGGAGDDILFGGTDADTLNGGVSGKTFDILNGEAGADTFVFASAEECGLSRAFADQLSDFSAAGDGDRIDLSTIDANTLLAGNQQFLFINAPDAAFGGVAGQLRYVTEGYVEGDLNGDAVADFFIAVNVTNNPTLTDAAFIL